MEKWNKSPKSVKPYHAVEVCLSVSHSNSRLAMDMWDIHWDIPGFEQFSKQVVGESPVGYSIVAYFTIMLTIHAYCIYIYIHTYLIYIYIYMVYIYILNTLPMYISGIYSFKYNVYVCTGTHIDFTEILPMVVATTRCIAGMNLMPRSTSFGIFLLPQKRKSSRKWHGHDNMGHEKCPHWTSPNLFWYM